MKKIYAIAASVLMASAVSCSEEIVLDRVDEGAYDNVVNLIGSLRDGKTGKVCTVVEMFSEDFNSEVAFNIARAPKEGVDVKVVYDKSYVDIYNKEHGTSYSALPEDRFSIKNGGKIVVAPDEKLSYSLGINTRYGQAPVSQKLILPPELHRNTADGYLLVCGIKA